MGKARVFLGLGTNIGDRQENLRSAIKELEKEKIKIKKLSSIYETEPIGVRDQDWFYNMVVEACAFSSAEELLLTVKDIEKKLGRVKSIRWGPRLIDIDLLLFDDLVVKKQIHENIDLKLPHPQLKNRAFVIEPLIEIEPDIKLPDGSPIKGFLEYTKEQKVRKVGQLVLDTR